MSVRKISKLDMRLAGFSDDIDNVQNYLTSETGTLVIDGKIVDCGDYYDCPVFSADGRSQSTSNAGPGRCMYQVLSEDGVATDGTSYEGGLVTFNFPKSLGFKKGSKFSAAYAHGLNIDPASIYLEFVPDKFGRLVPAEVERDDFESAGIEKKSPSWEPRTQPWTHPGHADSGDSRKRAEIETEFQTLRNQLPTTEELLARIEKLERRLTEKEKQ